MNDSFETHVDGYIIKCLHTKQLYEDKQNILFALNITQKGVKNKVRKDTGSIYFLQFFLSHQFSLYFLVAIYT